MILILWAGLGKKEDNMMEANSNNISQFEKKSLKDSVILKLKNTKVLIGIFIFFLLFSVSILILIASKSETDRKNTTENAKTYDKTANNFPLPEKDATLTIVNLTPRDKAIDVGINQAVTVFFNRNINKDEIGLSIVPEVDLNIDIRDDKLIFTPISSYLPGTLYTYLVKSKSFAAPPKTHNFQTTGPTTAFLPDTKDPEGQKQLDDFQKASHPDVYLSNRTPYENESFLIDAFFKDTPAGHFAFTASIKTIPLANGKKELNNWLLSLGLTQDQINNLDIEYGGVGP